MRCLIVLFSLFVGFIFTERTLFAEEPLSGKAASLYRQSARESRFFGEAQALHPQILPTSDGESFFLLWKSVEAPDHWIVSLHGAGQPARGFAADDLAIWYPHLKNRKIGLLCLQWWKGTGDGMSDFYRPEDMYREIEKALEKLHVLPGSVMFHGFSRGSANTYPVAALDSGRGEKYFSLIVASSGGVSLNYPPIRALLKGEYGREPLRGTQWITVAGLRDPNPERDGIPGMRQTAEWLEKQGAQVLLSIEDSSSGHGALQRNPENTERVLDLFLKAKK